MSRLDTPNFRRPIGCVSFLNARPLVEGMDDRADLDVRYDVPSALLEDLLAGEVELALCPVIDFQTSPVPLQIVPSGGIGCDGATLTVRLYSRVPLERVDLVHVDSDSHSSVVLLRVLLQDLYGRRPRIVELPSAQALPDAVTSLLLIGDKVVTAAPARRRYPFQLDLGEAWKRLTGLPFVFAVWMARAGADLADLPARLDGQRRANAGRLAAIAHRWAPRCGWPKELARHYLADLLRYEVGPRQLQAMQHFWQRAHALELIEQLKPLRLGAGPVDAGDRLPTEPKMGSGC